MTLKRIAAAMLAVLMATLVSITPAFAAAVNNVTCSICGYSFSISMSAAGNAKNGYETYFGVPSIDGLTNSGRTTWYTDIRDLQVANYHDGFICRNCLGKIISNYLDSSSSTKTSSTNVTASVPSSYSLIVPESVVMSGPMGTGEKVANIPVTIKGDIGEKQQIILTADAPTMRRQGSSDVISTAEISKSIWNRDDVVANNGDGTVSNCVIKAVLTPGEWSGAAVFNCSLATQDDSASDFDNNLMFHTSFNHDVVHIVICLFQ